MVFRLTPDSFRIWQAEGRTRSRQNPHKHSHTRRPCRLFSPGTVIPTHLLRDLGEVDVFGGVGDAPEASYILGAQEGDGGQGDVRLLKVLLDLLVVLRQIEKVKRRIGGALIRVRPTHGNFRALFERDNSLLSDLAAPPG